MNPEDNNFNPNPAPAPSPFNSDGSLNMADGLASAQDNLTSAGLAASTDDGVMDLNQLGSTAPEAMMTSPIDEPLIPAAPVPGSIGSVTSVPPLDSEPVAPASTHVADPAPAPYNPFAAAHSEPETAAPAPAHVPAPSVAPDPAFQPIAPARTGIQFTPLMIALAVAAGVLLVTTLIFIVLYIRAINTPKIVYVPQTPSGESSARIEMLTCSREVDFAGYAGVESPAMGSQTMNASYANDELKAMTLDYAMHFADEGAAGTAQAAFATEQAEVLGAISNSFTANYNVNGGNLDVQIASAKNNLAAGDAAILVYGLGNAESSTALGDVRGTYEAAGFVCSAE